MAGNIFFRFSIIAFSIISFWLYLPLIQMLSEQTFYLEEVYFFVFGVTYPISIVSIIIACLVMNRGFDRYLMYLTISIITLLVGFPWLELNLEQIVSVILLPIPFLLFSLYHICVKKDSSPNTPFVIWFFVMAAVTVIITSV